MLMKYLSEYQPSRMRSMSSLKTEAGSRRRSKMVMPTWIIASGDGVAGFGCERPPAWCPARRYGLLGCPSGCPGDRLPPAVRLTLAASALCCAAREPSVRAGLAGRAPPRRLARPRRADRPPRDDLEEPPR